MDETTFREEYTFYRIHPKTQALERSGAQTVLSKIGDGGGIDQSCRGSGTVLIDFKAKRQSFEARGEARAADPTHLKAEARGKIAVDGLPLNLGKSGKVRKVTGSLSLDGEQLIGQTRVEVSFGVWVVTKRHRIETQLRARRGSDIQTVAGRAPTS